ncbi:MAG: hypothetical protein ACYTXC_24645 [Nostoc sp.]
MIKKQIILPTLLFATILIGGMTGCSSSKSPDVSQGGDSGTKVSDTSTTNTASNTPDRAQKREEVRKQIEAVLTPDQVKELSTKLQQGEKMRKAVLSLNLTAEEKTKIQDIFKTAYSHRKGQSQDNS